MMMRTIIQNAIMIMEIVVLMIKAIMWYSDLNSTLVYIVGKTYYPHKMYTDRCSGIWAKQISTFRQFWAGEATAKNFFDLP